MPAGVPSLQHPPQDCGGPLHACRRPPHPCRRPLRACGRLLRTCGVLLAGSWCTTSTAHLVDPGEHTGWALQWSFDAWVLGGLALSLGLYVLGVGRLWRRAGIGHGVGLRAASAFAAGWLVVAIALVSPLDALGGQLFSLHMVQHELLMMVAAPLLVGARPLGAWAWALTAGQRRHVGAALRRPGWRAAWRTIRSPLVAWSLHAAALWLWHVPALFDAALADDAVHTLQHVSFLGSALLFWWAVLSVADRRRCAIALACVFTTMVHSGVLGALLTMSPRVLYAGYLPTTAALGVDALQDQQLGGLLMWVPAGLAYLGIGIVLAGRWLEAVADAPAPVHHPRNVAVQRKLTDSRL